mmetsp:Transcript_55/g.124  ORF Transcript_55/g.124 Transcript_55/m.124 type:complete len:92 (-) Transcript_55:262-537(-)
MCTHVSRNFWGVNLEKFIDSLSLKNEEQMNNWECSRYWNSSMPILREKEPIVAFNISYIKDQLLSEGNLIQYFAGDRIRDRNSLPFPVEPR